MFDQKISPARIYILLIIIICVGTVLGFILVFGKIGEMNRPLIANPAFDQRCSQKVRGIGACKMIKSGFEFNISANKCIERTAVNGCSFEIPFNSLEECDKTCRIGAVIKNELKFETIVKGLNSNETVQGNYVIKSDSEWLPILQKTNAELMAPIDFNKDTVVAVFQGEESTGGYSIEIGKITESENVIEVSVVASSPGRGCMVTEALTSPYHIVKFQKSKKEVVFNIEKAINDCK